MRATGDPRLRAELARIIRTDNVPARDPEALARAVQRRVQSLTYVREDPETWVHPARTLEWGIADCDDMATLCCALLRSARIPCRLGFAGWRQERSAAPVPLKHVFGGCFVAPQWRALECVRRVPFGFDPVEFYRSKGYQVRVVYEGDELPGELLEVRSRPRVQAPSGEGPRRW